MSKGPYTTWYDKVPGKTVNWKEKDWKKAVIDTFQTELLEEDHSLLKMLFLCLHL